MLDTGGETGSVIILCEGINSIGWEWNFKGEGGREDLGKVVWIVLGMTYCKNEGFDWGRSIGQRDGERWSETSTSHRRGLRSG